jgi:hypothetical protein
MVLLVRPPGWLLPMALLPPRMLLPRGALRALAGLSVRPAAVSL